MSISTQKPSSRDIADAIQHADSYGTADWDSSDFSLNFLGNLTASEVGQYDDLSSWMELRSKDFEGLSLKEKMQLLADFRGKKWAERASTWLKDGIPPIVIITYPDEDSGQPNTVIGDGRGRVNFASAFNIRVPTWELTHKSLRKESHRHMTTSPKTLKEVMNSSLARPKASEVAREVIDLMVPTHIREIQLAMARANMDALGQALDAPMRDIVNMRDDIVWDMPFYGKVKDSVLRLLMDKLPTIGRP